jgi:drug/metabolite transporter (DMT)-like permease
VPATQVAVVEGQRYLSPSIASPIVAAALGAAFLGERVSPRNVAGFAVALAGVALIVVLGAGTGADAQASDPLRASITVIGPIAWALYTLVSKPVSDRHHAVPVVGIAVMAGTLSLAPRRVRGGRRARRRGPGLDGLHGAGRDARAVPVVGGAVVLGGVVLTQRA